MTSKTTMVLEINELKAKLKAKDEKFIKILDELIKKIENADEQIEFDEWETFMIFNIQEIKQRIKEEGKIGQYRRIVYNNALEDVKKEIEQRIKDKEIKKLKERIEDLENILQEWNERE